MAYVKKMGSFEVKALESNHLENLKKWSKLELVAYENEVS